MAALPILSGRLSPRLTLPILLPPLENEATHCTLVRDVALDVQCRCSGTVVQDVLIKSRSGPPKGLVYPPGPPQDPIIGNF